MVGYVKFDRPHHSLQRIDFFMSMRRERADIGLFVLKASTAIRRFTETS